jgi:hypothetical protein
VEKKEEPEMIEEETGDLIEIGNEVEEGFETADLIINEPLDNIAALTEEELKYYELFSQ